ncbi:MAG: carbohydrate ABC transporter substrate-binding protein [Chloroflexi bacterium]|nr:carbohydrate ABC transporter substrate-binding protein [Chloroflexota bacterium]
MSNKKLWMVLGLVLLLALALAACGGTTTPTETTQEAAPTEAAAPAEEAAAPTEAAAPAEDMPMAAFPYPAGSFLERAIAGEFTGTVVTVDGPFADADVIRFDKSMVAFEEATGIDVQYIGGKEFEASISVRVDAGDAPDIADFPQPGLLAGFVGQGKVVDPSSYIPAEWLSQQYNQSWLDMAQMNGQSAGVWHRFNGKSLVWYPKAQFEAAGYEVPTTWDELVALMDTIVADGDTPLVYRRRIRCRHRLGRHRLDRGNDAPHHFPRKLRRLGPGHPALRLPRSQSRHRSLEQHLVQRQLCLRRPCLHRHHQLRRCPPAHV